MNDMTFARSATSLMRLFPDMGMLKTRKFHYYSYRDGVCGTICGQTANCALKKEFETEDIVWSHGSVTHDQAIYVVTADGKQFSVTIREVARDGGELR